MPWIGARCSATMQLVAVVALYLPLIILISEVDGTVVDSGVDVIDNNRDRYRRSRTKMATLSGCDK